ncbi:MAG: tRNA (adenosine(37)-N6)-threonylcarbamoyltransferase complex dimerization subunit type 1 TsaB [Endozoicomonas sp. (ex Botrylloides leachii)]|nr:tRNA (adenosine(37)-N6)-threonylcarbamoyltransferase complex dimerization subunit type 1 TsaB [Endozoicomonas sp. (ex Botrylloides leachii)]
MKLLALDTSTEACSVALNIDGEITGNLELLPRRHSREILPMVDKLLSKAGLAINNIDALVFGCGPGAFTGLRVATAIVQGLAFAADLPVIPVSTLAALAQQAYRCYGATHVLSAIDARMDEVYWGVFAEDDQLMMTQQCEMVMTPEKVILPMSESVSWVGIGTGWAYQQRLAVSVDTCYQKAFPNALDMVTLAVPAFKQEHWVSAEKAMPVYLRDNVAVKKRER